MPFGASEFSRCTHSHTLAAPRVAPTAGSWRPPESARRLLLGPHLRGPASVPRSRGSSVRPLSLLDYRPMRARICRFCCGHSTTSKLPVRILFLLRQRTVQCGRRHPRKLRRAKRRRGKRARATPAKLGVAVHRHCLAGADRACVNFGQGRQTLPCPRMGALNFAATVLHVWNVKWLHKSTVPSERAVRRFLRGVRKQGERIGRNSE